MIRVFIADDHGVVRAGVRKLLEDLDEFEVVGEARNGRQVLDADLGVCHALVLDLSLPVVSGLEVLRRIRPRFPFLKVIVLSMHPLDQFAHRAIESGAHAYVSKERPPNELVDTIRAAVRGEQIAPPPKPQEGLLHESLTKREHQVFTLLLEGRAVADIAAELDVHSCTVSNHLARVKKKLGADSIADIVRYAVSAGLVDPGPLEP